MTALTGEQWARIYAYAWLHPEFRQQLEQNPAVAIASVAHELDLQYEAIFQIPDPPAGMSADAIARVADGTEWSYFHHHRLSCGFTVLPGAATLDR